MGYRSLADCVRDLEKTGQLVAIDQEVDPHLEVAAIQRRVYQAGGPALLFRRARGSAFPLLGNLFGTLDRSKYLFRDTLESVRRLVELKVNPGVFGKNPWRYRGVPRTLLHLLPRRVRTGPDPGPPDPRLRSATDPVLADGWRPVHHPAAGLHGGPRPTWPGAIQPWDVPGPARRKRIRTGPRDRTALPDPPRHRRPPRRGDPSRRAPAREHLRRRPARDDGRRGDATARGSARAGVRRCTRRSSGKIGRARRQPPDARRGRLRRSAARSTRIAASPRVHSETTSVITASSMISRFSGSIASTTATEPSGRSRRSAVLPRRTRPSAP